MTIALDPTASYVIMGNYGNDTIALIQWAYEQGLKQVTVVSVETGWSAPEWAERVQRAEEYVARHHFKVVRLIAQTPFDKLMQQRHSFPSTKFQWCANILKGLPILDWLDQNDPGLNSILLIGHRHASSRTKKHLPEKIDESEWYGERSVIYPLIKMETSVRDTLIARAGFAVLSHRSLECDPCINSDTLDLARLSEFAITRTAALEKILGSTMFKQLAENHERSDISNLVREARDLLENVRPTTDILENMGCGDPYGCGI